MPSNRITNADLDQQLTVLKNISGLPYYIESSGSPQRPRLYREVKFNDSTGAAEVSPRLSKAELYRWMDAYIDGFHMAKRIERGELS